MKKEEFIKLEIKGLENIRSNNIKDVVYLGIQIDAINEGLCGIRAIYRAKLGNDRIEEVETLKGYTELKEEYNKLVEQKKSIEEEIKAIEEEIKELEKELFNLGIIIF